MQPHYFVQGLFLVSGLIAFLASVFDWEWFFTARNVQFLITRIGRRRTRLVYGIIGIVCMALAAYMFWQTREAFGNVGME